MGIPLYKCKVRVGGSLYNEVAKSGVTIPEIILLRLTHKGDESVQDIAPLGREAVDVVGTDDEGKPIRKVRTERMERDRLREIYGRSFNVDFDRVFPPGVPLPQVLDGVEEAAVEQPVRRTRRAAAEVEAELHA